MSVIPSNAALVARRRDDLSLEWLPPLTLIAFFFRDAFAGALRYYTEIFHASALWFLPDFMAFACLPYFFYKAVWADRNALALVTIIVILAYVVLGGIFLASGTAAISAFKMIAPIFVGFCFYDRPLSKERLFLVTSEAILYLTIAGIILSHFERLPWTGFAFESFGAVKTAGRLWWASSSERLAGFAADSTMAALFVVLSFALASFRKSVTWCLLVGGLCIYAIKLTTNKTSLGTLALYLLCLLVCRALPEWKRFAFVRKVALISFVAPLVPFILITVLSGVDLTSISDLLFSLQDRINNSWQLPFSYISELFPPGLLLGCGLGCFNYPQQEFSYLSEYWVPVDNFYLGTYIMCGLPFVCFVIKVFLSMTTEEDVYKLVIIFVMNVYTVTVLSYGPAANLMVIAVGFSTVFRNNSRTARPAASMPLDTPLRRVRHGIFARPDLLPSRTST